MVGWFVEETTSAVFDRLKWNMVGIMVSIKSRCVDYSSCGLVQSLQSLGNGVYVTFGLCVGGGGWGCS